MKPDNQRGKLQRRVFALFGGFTLTLCLLYSGIAILVAYVVEDQLLDNLVKNEARYIEQSFRESGRYPAPRLPEFTLYSPADQAPQEYRAALAGERRKSELFVAGEQHFHLRELAPGSGAILAAEVSKLLTVSTQSDRLAWLLISILCGTTALALWLAHRLAAATIRPVLHLAHEVDSQPAMDQATILSTANRADEIGFLARTLQNNIDDLRQARQREAEFTRDVSHELRTGLAIATNTLTLAQDRNLSGEESQQLRAIMATLNKTVDTLLALARAESLEHTTFNLRLLLEDRLLARPEISSDDRFQLKVTLPDSVPVDGNPQLARLLLDILLDNAIRHASEPALEIYQAEDALVFANPIRHQVDTASLFSSGARRAGSDGLGHGLYLANRILSTMQWNSFAHCNGSLFRVSVSPL